MKIIYTDEIEISQLSRQDQLAFYNAHDVMITREIFDELEPLLDETTRKTYEFEKSLQGPVLDMEMRGVLVDQVALGNLTKEHNKKLLALEKILAQIVDATGYHEAQIERAESSLTRALARSMTKVPPTLDVRATDLPSRKLFIQFAKPEYEEAKKIRKKHTLSFNARSPKEKIELLYRYLGAKTIMARSKTTNEMTATTDRAALEKIRDLGFEKTQRSTYFWTRPIVNLILSIMDESKILGFLKTKLEDGRFKTSFNISGTNTGRFSSNSNPQDYGQNFQNISDPLRVIFIPDPGHKFAYIDYEQAESRSVGAICFTLFGATAYLDAQESGDPHSLVCQMIWPDLPWPAEFNLEGVKKYGHFPPDLLRAAKKVANQKFYRTMTYRDLAKRASHGSNYYGTPRTMAMHTKVPTRIMEDFQWAYFDAFPEIPRWHQAVATELQTTSTLTTLAGRRRLFFGRPDDDVTLRAAIAYGPQSFATGDYTNEALLRVWKANLPIDLFLQQHDAIGFAYKAKDEKNLILHIQELMTIEIQLTSPTGSHRAFSIPTEAQVGWNLAHARPSNPSGLEAFFGSDHRIAPKPSIAFDLLGTII